MVAEADQSHGHGKKYGMLQFLQPQKLVWRVTSTRLEVKRDLGSRSDWRSNLMPSSKAMMPMAGSLEGLAYLNGCPAHQ